MDQKLHAAIRETPPEMREMRGDSVRDAPVEPRVFKELWSRPWLAFGASAVLPGLFLSFLGPFGTFGAPLEMRLAYWMPTMAIGALIGAALALSLDRVEALRSRPWIRLAVLIALMTVAMTIVASIGARLVFGARAINMSLWFAFNVLVVTAIVTGFVTLLRANRADGRNALRPTSDETPIEPAEGPATDDAARTGAKPLELLRRLSPRLKTATILALEAEDHYVRVHTDLGSELILMRLADGIAEVEAIEGARTHRSWWVARAAIDRTHSANGRASVWLSNGQEVPVSRSQREVLIRNGWLTP